MIYDPYPMQSAVIRCDDYLTIPSSVREPVFDAVTLYNEAAACIIQAFNLGSMVIPVVSQQLDAYYEAALAREAAEYNNDVRDSQYPV